ncbi:SusC/RagA family TonB-linked outer membrane protein [Polaribacter sp.]|uniref:SusC/RagA family TonB-linked outer membrane protein n=1 Tax=Polaribacter sp. TaxID=1920175 RepID=UPI003F6B04FC
MITIKSLFSNYSLSLFSKKWQLFMVIIMLCSINSFAQQKTITGTVTDSSGEIIPGVNILIKGSKSGTSSDFDGKYSIKAKLNDVIVFSYLGYSQKEIVVGESTTINVVLKENATSLDEIVVVGYGSQRKSDLTGSVSLVDTEEMTKQASNDVTQMMQGRVAGVSITSDGQPGAAPSVRIRGVATFGIGASAEPLYVVDGVPIDGIRDINPNDIESVQVLKDASAGAIYGNRAGNGVIIITTKSGRKGQKTSISLSSYYGVQSITQKLPLLDRVGYQTINRELINNGGNTIPIPTGNDPNSPDFIDNIDTDWQDEGFTMGYIQNHNFSVSGGTEKSNYFMSLDYLDNEGTLVGQGPNYRRYSFRVNSEAKFGKFTVGENLFFVNSDENPLFDTASINLPGGRPTLVNDLLQAAPTIPVRDPNRLGGFGGANSTIHNSITLNVPGINTLIDTETKVNRLNANLYASFEPVDGLVFKSSGSFNTTNITSQLFVPQYDLGYFFPNPLAQLRVVNTNISRFLLENTASYTKEFGKHNLSVLAGQTFQKDEFRAVTAVGGGLTEPYVLNLGNATEYSVFDNIQEAALFSLLGRVNYSFDDKYFFTGNVRYDGSSKFNPDVRYQVFPSVSAAWKIHNEFELPDFISTLKLRGGWGEVGNQEVGNYLYQRTINRGIPYQFSGGSTVVGAAVTSLIDEDIKWETRQTSSIGIDASLFNGALDFTAEYYRNTSKDVLVNIPVPYSNTVGAFNSEILSNAGSIRNSGIELSAVYRQSVGNDFSFEIAPNFYTVKNEILEIGGQEFITGAGTRNIVGRSLGEHYGWVYDGIFQSAQEVAGAPFQTPGTAAGDIKYKDISGPNGTPDGVVNDQDRTFLGQGLPTYYYGLNITAKYKDFDFTIFGQGSGGNLINSNLYRGLMPTQGFTNWHEDILNRWTPTNTNTTVPRVVLNDPNNNQRDSDRPGWLQDGDYFRLNTISLGYSLPQDVISKLSISNARFFVTLQNVAVFSKYKGYNPDFQAGVLNPGFDFGTYPRPMTTMLGFQLKF